MKQIQRHLFILVCLLMGIGGYADNFKIIRLDKSSGDESCTLTAKILNTDADITAGTTEIAEGTWVKLTVACGSNYTLTSLRYEEVTTIDQAEAPRRATPPPYVSVYDFNIEVNYPQYAVNHFAGDYTFYMPKNNIIVTATYTSLTTFHDNTNINFSISGSTIYDGTVRSLIVKDGETPLREGLDFRITAMTLNGSSTGTDHTIQKAGNYVVTVQGIGKYQDSKESGTLTISKKALKITAWNQSYQYAIGRTISTGTGYVTIDDTDGLVAEDNLTGITLTQSTTNVTGSTPGTITPSAATTTNGIENYAVTYVAGSLTITQRPFNSGTFPITQTFTWVNYSANTEQIPGITVKDGETTLTENTDYVLAYSSHFFPSEAITDFSKPDIYYVTITFQGNYSGSAQVEYQIRKEVVLNTADAYKWSTYYDPSYDMEVATTDHFQAFTVSGVNSQTVEIVGRSYIKKGTPMLLYKKDNTTSSFPPLVKEVPDWGTTNNYMKGNATARYASDIQTAEGGKEIWILVNDNFVRTKSGVVPANKCYLALGSSISYSSPMLINLNPTGINVHTKDSINLNGIWYTIDGRKLQGLPAKKGIYINNGKKIIIK